MVHGVVLSALAGLAVIWWLVKRDRRRLVEHMRRADVIDLPTAKFRKGKRK